MLKRLIVVLALLASSAFVAAPATAAEDEAATETAAAKAEETAPEPEAPAPKSKPDPEPPAKVVEPPAQKKVDPPANPPADLQAAADKDPKEPKEPKDPKEPGDPKEPDPKEPEEDPDDAKTVTICNANEGVKSYTKNTVSASAILKGNQGSGADIVPPFEHAKGTHPGLNWDAAGQKIHGDGCVVGDVSAEPDPDAVEKKVTICHMNEGNESFYTVMSIARAAILNGSSEHATDANDIIPPFEGYPGKNWDEEGQAIFDNGCVDGGVVIGPDPDDKKVTICHMNEGNESFYTVMSIARAAILNGSSEHATDANDIIPPFEGYPGKNWDEEGQAIFENGCVDDGSIGGEPEEVAPVFEYTDPCVDDDEVVLLAILRGIIVSDVPGLTETFTVGDGVTGPWRVEFTPEGDNVLAPGSPAFLEGDAGDPADCGGPAGEPGEEPTDEDLDPVGDSDSLTPQVAGADVLPDTGGSSLWLLLVGVGAAVAGAVALRMPRPGEPLERAVPGAVSAWSVPGAPLQVAGMPAVAVAAPRPRWWVLAASAVSAVVGLVLLTRD